MGDEMMLLEAPVPTGSTIAEEVEISLVVELTRTTDETPVPVGAVRPADTVLLVPLP